MKSYKLLKWIIGICITAIFVIAFINFVRINRRVNDTIISAKKDYIHSSLLKEEAYDSLSVNRENYYAILFSDLESIKKGVFDSNTITFLVCFTISLLFTILLTLQSKLVEQKTLVEDAIKQVQNEKITQKYYIKLYGLHCGGVLLNDVLSRDCYKVSEATLNIVYIMDREAQDLLKEIPESMNLLTNTIRIDTRDCSALIKIIYNTIHFLNIEKIQEANKSQLISIRSIINLHQKLSDLASRFELMSNKHAIS
ncbi:MAG: hypothetical protein E7112_06370 [Bacteroidales bacterium]|nr:hypothetical protein [Bacteroidales bacterium]